MPWTKIFIDKNVPVSDEDSGSSLRKLTYSEAIREALFQAMAIDRNVFVMGQGVDDPSGMFGTTTGLREKFGPERVFDTPLSENGLTGIAVGAALTGLRPVYVHNRPDFLLLTMDQLANHAAKWRYMFGGKHRVPMVVRAVIGRGWGSGAQHSQSLYGLFMHIPGLRLILPATAYDAKGLLLSAVADNNPVIMIEHRWLYRNKSYVPEKMYYLPFGKGVVRRRGSGLTIVAVSYMVIEALRAAETLAKENISAEVIDPRTLSPLDEELILESVKKTGRLVIADTDWKTCGASAEISALVAEKAQGFLKAPVSRVAWPDLPVPSGCTLEAAFYPGEKEIVRAAKEIINSQRSANLIPPPTKKIPRPD